MKQDATMRGKEIKQGQMVFQMLMAANRDPAVFADPDVFDVRREDNKHIAFGYGAHYCIGASLSRMEGQVVFDTVMDRMPDIKMTDEAAHWDPTKPNSRLLKHLHVTF
jgi:cytochrome P450